MYVMRLDGTHRRNVTNTKRYWESSPDWASVVRSDTNQDAAGGGAEGLLCHLSDGIYSRTRPSVVRGRLVASLSGSTGMFG